MSDLAILTTFIDTRNRGSSRIQAIYTGYPFGPYLVVIDLGTGYSLVLHTLHPFVQFLDTSEMPYLTIYRNIDLVLFM